MKKTIPAPVQAGFAASAYSTWKIDRIDKLIKPESEQDPRFRLRISDGGKRFTLVLNKDGKILTAKKKGA